jgi:hypothetical protein
VSVLQRWRCNEPHSLNFSPPMNSYENGFLA